MTPLPPLEPDPVIEAYKKDVDRTLLRENLKLTPEQRICKLMELQRFAEELRRAGREAKEEKRHCKKEHATMSDSEQNDVTDVHLLRARQIDDLRDKILIGVEEIERGDSIKIANEKELAAFFDEIADEVDRELDAE